MGWWPFKSEKAPANPAPVRNKGGRPTRAQAAEKRKRLLDEKKLQLDLLEMDRKIKDLASGGGEEDELDMRTVKRVIKYLEELGFEVRPKGGGEALEDDGIMATLRSLAPAIGAGVGKVIMANLAPSDQAVIVGEAREISAAHSLPAPAPVPSRPEPAPQQAPQPTAAQEEQEMDFAAMYVSHNLKGKAPDQRAAWLLAMDNPEVKGLVTSLCRTPDGQLAAFISQLVAANPGLAGVGSWILAQGDLWIVETVRELRKQTGANPPARMGI